MIIIHSEAWRAQHNTQIIDSEEQPQQPTTTKMEYIK